jgi:hypothetical protein
LGDKGLAVPTSPDAIHQSLQTAEVLELSLHQAGIENYCQKEKDYLELQLCLREPERAL